MKSEGVTEVLHLLLSLLEEEEDVGCQCGASSCCGDLGVVGYFFHFRRVRFVSMVGGRGGGGIDPSPFRFLDSAVSVASGSVC